VDEKRQLTVAMRRPGAFAACRDAAQRLDWAPEADAGEGGLDVDVPRSLRLLRSRAKLAVRLKNTRDEETTITVTGSLTPVRPASRRQLAEMVDAYVAVVRGGQPRELVVGRITKNRIAALLAGLAAVVVAIVGGFVVAKPAFDHRGDVTNQNPFTPRTTEEVVTKEVAGKPTETTTTRKPESSGFVERALGNSGLFLLRVGIVALAAFLAAAVVQRTIMGDYALKVGPLEIPALTEASETALEGVKADLERLNGQVAELERARRAGIRRDSKTRRTTATLASRLAALEDAVTRLEPPPKDGGGRNPPP
jgi:hypothetical protein